MEQNTTTGIVMLIILASSVGILFRLPFTRSPGPDQDRLEQVAAFAALTLLLALVSALVAFGLSPNESDYY
jgi:hypothetical protein